MGVRYFVLFFLLLITLLKAEEQSSYQLGEGVQLGSLPLYLGGYFSLDYKSAKKEYRHYRLDDVAFLMYGEHEKFSYLAELEFKEFYTYIKEDNQSARTEKNTHLHLERLFVDYSYDDTSTFRLGKYNTPIGYWNLLPINILRDTTSSPKVTTILFPRFSTGVGYKHEVFGRLSEHTLNIIAQYNDDFDKTYNNYNVDSHFGVGYRFDKDAFSFKVDGGYFHLKPTQPNQDRYYLLLATKYENEQYKITAEVGRQQSSNKATTPYALYIQGLYHIAQKHSLIVRYEAYKENIGGSKDSFGVFGYTYRPLYPVAIKAEYQLHDTSINDQFLFSFSVLF